jgi:hypothetical protein
VAKVRTSNPDRTLSLKAAVRKLEIIIITLDRELVIFYQVKICHNQLKGLRLGFPLNIFKRLIYLFISLPT